ncbi:MAG: hypothetical protein JWO60_534 [Frankiales bacterium]|nr:hypothetical protein [Frankiales bacterium]
MLRPVLVYTFLRFVLFAGAYGLLLVVGVRDVLAIVGALLLSALGSVVLLKRQRDDIAVAASARREASLAERERLQARLRDEA